MEAADAADRVRVREIQASGKKPKGFQEGIVKGSLDIEYPRAAEKQGLEGVVTARLSVDKRGKISSLETQTGEEPFLKPTLSAARALRFWAPKLDGIEKEMTVELTVTFTRKACP